ncbi:MAG: CehA/McbA family metallohydrolase [Chloroflexota bacterium]
MPALSALSWYRGDLHVHTTVSADGATADPSAIPGMARDAGLDFVAITDHNTIAALAQLPSNPEVVIIPGIEVTLDAGDFNVFGIEGWHPWMEHVCLGQVEVSLGPEGPTAAELLRQTASEGLLNSINHPLLPPWAWKDDATELRFVHCLEVWNDPCWPDNAWANPAAVALWTRWLDEGHRVTAIGGSDYHHPPQPQEGKPGERLGHPTTYVGAGELAVDALLEGLRRRRAYVTVGPRVAFRACTGERMYDIGHEVESWHGEVEFEAAVGLPDAAPALARIVGQGGVVAEGRVTEDCTDLHAGVTVAADASRWFRFEVVDLDGRFLAITNPIFVGPRRAPRLRTYGELSP